MSYNMEVSSVLNLQWNNYLENLKSLFKNALEDQSFVDVTIVCQDGFLPVRHSFFLNYYTNSMYLKCIFFQAHKLVLSASSPYFKKLFQENPCTHPTVIMKEVTILEMQRLIHFIYLGFVEVEENNLFSLLKLAREFQIKGQL